MPWDKVDIRVLGVEIAHTGAVFDGTTEDIVKLLEDQNYVYKVLNTHTYIHIHVLTIYILFDRNANHLPFSYIQDNAGHDRFFVKEKII